MSALNIERITENLINSSSELELERINDGLIKMASLMPEAFNAEAKKYSLADVTPTFGQVIANAPNCCDAAIESMLDNDVDLISNPKSGYCLLKSSLTNQRYEIFCKVVKSGAIFDEPAASKALVLLAKQAVFHEQEIAGSSIKIAEPMRLLAKMGGDLRGIVKRKTTVVDYLQKNACSDLSNLAVALCLDTMMAKRFEKQEAKTVVVTSNAFDF